MDSLERLPLEPVALASTPTAAHVQCYELAAALCQGLRVVDLACGGGYGSQILNRTASSVLGVDPDAGTIRLAAATIGREAGIELVTDDVVRFLEGDLEGRFDAIVMFEALEQLLDPGRALAALRRHAEDGLLILVSIRNGTMREEQQARSVTDYGYDEAREVLAALPDATLLFQYLAEGAVISEDYPAADDGHFVLVGHGEPPYANTFIACANATEALDRWARSAHMRLAVAPTYNRQLLNLERANLDLRRANARLARGYIGKADSAAADLLAHAEDLERRLEEAQAELERVRNGGHPRIEELDAEVRGRDQIIDDMRRTKVWRVGQRYWGLRDGARRIVRRR